MTFRLGPGDFWWNGQSYVQPTHREWIANEGGYQCLDCGRWSNSLNVLNAVDCEEVEGLTLEELKA